MTARETAQRQQAAVPEPETPQGLGGVARTTRMEAAARPQQGAEQSLIYMNHAEGESAQNFAHYLGTHALVFTAIRCQWRCRLSRRAGFGCRCAPLRSII